MTCIDIHNQDEYDARKDEPGACLHVVGDAHVEAWGSAHVVARDSAHVEAWGSAHVEASDSAHVVAWDSAHVEARGSAHVVASDSAHVVASGSAHVEASGSAHVEAWDSAHVVASGSAHVVAWGSAHVEAWGSAHVEASGSAHVEATKCVAVHKQPGFAGTIVGGVVIDVPDMTQAAPTAWAEFTDTQVEHGHMVVYKAVDGDLHSGHGTHYPIGETVTAPDWNPVRECGSGLHFSPHPLIAATYLHADTKRYLACRVALDDVVVLDGSKVKARSCVVLHEVGADREPVETAK